MRQNFSRNKKKLEEAKRRKREEKRNRRLGKKSEIASPETPLQEGLLTVPPLDPPSPPTEI